MSFSTQQERVTVSTQEDRIASPLASWLRGWRPVAALITLAGGAVVITGAFLPWVEAFAGLIPIPGVRGDNGKILVAAGAVMVAAGLWQLATGSRAARWLGGLTGFAASAFAGHLLIQLTTTMHTLAGDSMFAVRGGPGLAVTTAGAIAVFATLLLPPSSQTTFRRARPASDRAGRAAGSAAAAGADAAGADATAPAPAGSASGAMPLTARLATAPGLRHGLQLALGVVWLLDAALQYQPVMFGKMFATMMLAPSAAGQPFFVAGPVHLTVRIVAASPVAWNAAFATVQLALGAGLLFRRTARAALAGSIAWSLAVWWLGEGLGGIVTGSATPLTGAPGGAVLYALLAVLAWPSVSPARHARQAVLVSVAESGPLGRYAKLAWLATWAGMAALTLHAPFQAATLTAAGGTSAHVVTAVLTAACGFAAVGVLFPATIRAALITAVATALIIWTAGEDYGAIFSGMATDPNSGPLLVLLALAFWPVRPVPAALVAAGDFEVRDPVRGLS